VAFLIVRNERDAEEILADTMLTAWRKIDSLRDPERLRSWLLTTATRLALRRLRRFQPRLLSLDVANDIATTDPSPIGRLVLGEAINGLPPRMRAVIALYYLADLPTAEVATAVGRSENTVKTQLREARAKLRLALADAQPETAALRREERT
jgi:RNA polymerase sigma-70 factor (ECF subfamily)